MIDLPEGASPIDFAYHIHSEIGDHMSGVKINGKMVPFSEKLISGDTVEIITRKNQRPNSDWLGLAQSSLARGHIRSALRKYGVELTTSRGRDKSKKRDVTLLISRINRIGLLRDVATLLSRDQITILKTEAEHGNIEKPYLTLKFQVPKNYDLDKLLTRIKRVRGVTQIEIKP